MQIPLTDIYVNPEERLRYETFGNTKEFAESLRRHGQIQDIAVRVYDGDLPYRLVDGGRRLLALQWLDIAGTHAPNNEPGCIGAKLVEAEDDLDALEKEYVANDARMDFSWKERLGFIRRIHEGYADMEDNWTQADTAAILKLTQKSISRYLSLIRDDRVYNDPAVQKSETLNTALKQADIVREKLDRERIVKLRKRIPRTKKRHSSTTSTDPLSDDLGLVELDDLESTREEYSDVFDLLLNEDLRTWLPDQPSNNFDWFHWDPPYGAEQGGGAFSSHKSINDSETYALELLEFGIPEIYRTLRDGCWLALWHHPSLSHEIQLYLQGHVRDLDGETCRYCEKPWPTFENPSTLANGCPGGEWTFWVNPYPFIWYKSNREADGHDIKRFCINQYEQFFLAGKMTTKQPILPNTDGGNVLVHDMPERSERRHIMHKPWPLLAEILNIISIPGEFGADCSVGSGSIFEAALYSGRMMCGTEIDKDNWVAATYVYEKTRREIAKRIAERGEE